MKHLKNPLGKGLEAHSTAFQCNVKVYWPAPDLFTTRCCSKCKTPCFLCRIRELSIVLQSSRISFDQTGGGRMKNRQQFGRREFLKTTGGALGLFVAATHVPSAIANTAEGVPPPVKPDPAQLKRLLDQMDAKGYQFWSVPRKDGEFLHFLVKATMQGMSSSWGPHTGFLRFGWGSHWRKLSVG